MTKQKITRNLFGGKKPAIKSAKPGKKRKAFLLKDKAVNRFLNNRHFRLKKRTTKSRRDGSNINVAVSDSNQRRPRYTSPPSIRSGIAQKVLTTNSIQPVGGLYAETGAAVVLTAGAQGTGAVDGTDNQGSPIESVTPPISNASPLGDVQALPGAAAPAPKKIFSDIGPEILGMFRFRALDNPMGDGTFEGGNTGVDGTGAMLVDFDSLLESRFLLNRWIFQIGQMIKKQWRGLPGPPQGWGSYQAKAYLESLIDQGLVNSSTELWQMDAAQGVNMFGSSARVQYAERDSKVALGLIHLLQKIETVASALDFRDFLIKYGHTTATVKLDPDNTAAWYTNLSHSHRPTPKPVGNSYYSTTMVDLDEVNSNYVGDVDGAKEYGVGWSNPSMQGRIGWIYNNLGGFAAAGANSLESFGTSTKLWTQLLHDLKVNLIGLGPAFLGPGTYLGFESYGESISNSRKDSSDDTDITKPWDLGIVDRTALARLSSLNSPAGTGISSDPMAEGTFRDVTAALGGLSPLVNISMLSRELSASIGTSLAINDYGAGPAGSFDTPEVYESGAQFLDRVIGTFSNLVYDYRSPIENLEQDGTIAIKAGGNTAKQPNLNSLAVLTGGSNLTYDEQDRVFPFEKFRAVVREFDTGYSAPTSDAPVSTESGMSGRQALINSSLNPLVTEGPLSQHTLLGFKPLKEFSTQLESRLERLAPYMRYVHCCYSYGASNVPSALTTTDGFYYAGQVAHTAPAEIIAAINSAVIGIVEGLTSPINKLTASLEDTSVAVDGVSFPSWALHPNRNVIIRSNAMNMIFLHILRSHHDTELGKRIRYILFRIVMLARAYRSNWAAPEGSVPNVGGSTPPRTSRMTLLDLNSPTGAPTPDEPQNINSTSGAGSSYLGTQEKLWRPSITIDEGGAMAQDGFFDFANLIMEPGLEGSPNTGRVTGILQEFAEMLQLALDDIVINTADGDIVFGTDDPLDDKSMASYLSLVGHGDPESDHGVLFYWTGLNDQDMYWQALASADIATTQMRWDAPTYQHGAGSTGVNNMFIGSLVEHLRTFILTPGGQAGNYFHETNSKYTLGDTNVFESILDVVDSLYRACNRAEEDSFDSTKDSSGPSETARWVRLVGTHDADKLVTRHSGYTDSTVHFLVFDAIINLLTGKGPEGTTTSTLPLDLVTLKRVGPGGAATSVLLEMVVHTFEAGVVSTVMASHANLSGGKNITDPYTEQGQSTSPEYGFDTYGMEEIPGVSITKNIIPNDITIEDFDSFKQELMVPMGSEGFGVLRREQVRNAGGGFFAPLDAFLLLKKHSAVLRGAVRELRGSGDYPNGGDEVKLNDIAGTIASFYMMYNGELGGGVGGVDASQDAVQLAQLQVQKVKGLSIGGLASAVNRVHALTSAASVQYPEDANPNSYLHTDLPGVSGCNVLETPSTWLKTGQSSGPCSIIFRSLKSMMRETIFTSEKAKNVRVLSVGMPNGVLDGMIDGFIRLNKGHMGGHVADNSDDIKSPSMMSVLRSSLIKISVHRRDHLHPGLAFRPLEFIYDMFVYPRTFDLSADYEPTGFEASQTEIPAFSKVVGDFKFARVNGFFAADGDIMSVLGQTSNTNKYSCALNTTVIVNRGKEIMINLGFDPNSDTAVDAMGKGPTPTAQPDCIESYLANLVVQGTSTATGYDPDTKEMIYSTSAAQDYIYPMLYNHVISFLLEKYYQATMGLRLTENNIQHGLMGFLNDLVLSERGVNCINLHDQIVDQMSDSVDANIIFWAAHAGMGLVLPLNMEMRPGDTIADTPTSINNFLMPPTGILQAMTNHDTPPTWDTIGTDFDDGRFRQVCSFSDMVATGGVLTDDAPVSVSALNLAREILQNLPELHQSLTHYQAYPKPIDRVFYIPVDIDDFVLEPLECDNAAMERGLEMGYITIIQGDSTYVEDVYVFNRTDSGSGDEVALDDYFCTVELLFGGKDPTTYRPTSPSIQSMVVPFDVG